MTRVKIGAALTRLMVLDLVLLRDFILQNLPTYQLNGIAFYAYK